MQLHDLQGGAVIMISSSPGHTSGINSVSLSADGSRCASAGADGRIKLWDMVTGTCIRTFEGHGGPVHSVDLSADGASIASGARYICRCVYNEPPPPPTHTHKRSRFSSDHHHLRLEATVA